MTDRVATEAGDRREWFVTTRWSVVGRVDAPDSSAARSALEMLCRAYWYPLYAYLRRAGKSPADAEDLVQGFFAQCLTHGWFTTADPSRGRFRSFLLVLLKRFLGHEGERSRALKRGGGQPVVALDSLSAEERYALEPANSLAADRLYDRRWALTILERVLGRLEMEQSEAGRAAEFAVLRETLTGAGAEPHADLADRLGMTPGAVKVAMHRLRQRYRELLDEEIAGTVVDPTEVGAERQQLKAALLAGG